VFYLKIINASGAADNEVKRVNRLSDVEEYFLHSNFYKLLGKLTHLSFSLSILDLRVEQSWESQMRLCTYADSVPSLNNGGGPRNGKALH